MISFLVRSARLYRDAGCTGTSVSGWHSPLASPPARLVRPALSRQKR